MKRKYLLLLLSCVATLSLTACTETTPSGSVSTEDELSSTLSSTYDFYNESVEILKENMGVDTQQANTIFETLISIGLDEEISYCFDEDGYYKVWWGLTKVDVYLTDGSIDKIMDDDAQLYPVSENKLNIPDEIIWKDEDNMGIVNLRLDGTKTKEGIISSYYVAVAEYIETVDKSTLKDYEYIRFVGNVVREEKIECTIKGNISVDYIKEADRVSYLDAEDNMTDLFIPKPLE